jgi:hypothetical protein
MDGAALHKKHDAVRGGPGPAESVAGECSFIAQPGDLSVEFGDQSIEASLGQNAREFGPAHGKLAYRRLQINIDDPPPTVRLPHHVVNADRRATSRNDLVVDA